MFAVRILLAASALLCVLFEISLLLQVRGAYGLVSPTKDSLLLRENAAGRLPRPEGEQQEGRNNGTSGKMRKPKISKQPNTRASYVDKDVLKDARSRSTGKPNRSRVGRRSQRQLRADSTGMNLGVLPFLNFNLAGGNLVDNVVGGGGNALLDTARNVLGVGPNSQSEGATTSTARSHTPFVTLADWSLLSGLTSGSSPVAGVVGSLDLARTIAMDMTSRAYEMSSMLQGLNPEQLTERVRGFIGTAASGFNVFGGLRRARILLDASSGATGDATAGAQQVAFSLVGRLQAATDRAVKYGRELVGSLGLLEAMFSGGARLPLVGDVLTFDELLRGLQRNPDETEYWAAMISTLRRLQAQLLPFPEFFELDIVQVGYVNAAVSAIEDLLELLRHNPLRLGNQIADAFDRIGKNLLWLDHATLLPRVEFASGVDLLALFPLGGEEGALTPFTFELGSSIATGYVFDELRSFFFDGDRLQKVFGDLTNPLLALDSVTSGFLGPSFWNLSSSYWIPESIREVSVIGDALRYFESLLGSGATPLRRLESEPETLFAAAERESPGSLARPVLNEVVEQLGEIVSGQSAMRMSKLFTLKGAEELAESFLGALRELNLSRDLVDALFENEYRHSQSDLRVASVAELDDLLSSHAARVLQLGQGIRARRRLAAAEAAPGGPDDVPTNSKPLPARFEDTVADAFVTMSVSVATIYSFVDSLRSADVRGLCNEHKEGTPSSSAFSQGLRSLSATIQAADVKRKLLGEVAAGAATADEAATAAAVADATTMLNVAGLLGDPAAIVDAAADEDIREVLTELFVGNPDQNTAPYVKPLQAAQEPEDHHQIEMFCRLDALSESLILSGLAEMLYSVNLGLDLLALEGDNVIESGVKYCQQALEAQDALRLPPGVKHFLSTDCLQLAVDQVHAQQEEKADRQDLPENKVTDQTPDSEEQPSSNSLV